MNYPATLNAFRRCLKVIDTFRNEHGVYDVIGGDNTFACNAGMNALMHVASWMGSPLWNGKLGLVVTADFSHTATAIRYPYDRVWNGAAACAAVIAPHAALAIDTYESRDKATPLL